jgi:hypothetical protein
MSEDGKPIVAFLGPEASYTHQVSIFYAGEKSEKRVTGPIHPPFITHPYPSINKNTL